MRKITHFQNALLSWFDKHGRHDLPWQQARTPYRVWISEIMLQQTQVSTVIPYFERFMQRFPSLSSLANAELDDVLQYWSGLGYYARARNIHRAAHMICESHETHLPNDLDALCNLPGIGRSTAGAILAMAFEIRAPILDGNVKRVLTRQHCISGWPGQSKVEKKLWELADTYTPHARIADYTQAIMDLGAGICARTNPDCANCPVHSSCLAAKNHTVDQFPEKRPKKTLPLRKSIFLLLYNKNNEILMQKRPPVGIWGGLWSLPECPDNENIRSWCKTQFHCRLKNITPLESLRHTFSHFHLDITPIRARICDQKLQIMDRNDFVWYKETEIKQLALAAPVKRLLTQRTLA